jgi:hypothetical protein
MYDGEQAATWVVLVLGVSALVTGAVTVARGKVALPWLGQRVFWRPWGWGQVSLGVFIMLETVPRLADGPDALVLVLSLVALAPLAGCIVLCRGARLRRT